MPASGDMVTRVLARPRSAQLSAAARLKRISYLLIGLALLCLLLSAPWSHPGRKRAGLALVTFLGVGAKLPFVIAASMLSISLSLFLYRSMCASASFLPTP